MRTTELLSAALLALAVIFNPTYAAPAAGSAPLSKRQADIGALAPPGATKIDVREHGLYAEFYVPAHTGPLPALIAIGGAEGGLDTVSNLAATFVPSGYAVLALAYFGEPGLPNTLEGVPLEYFRSAVEWLTGRAEVDPRRVAVIGWSRGAEAALLIATDEPKIHAVIAVAPSSYVWVGQNFKRTPGPAWTLGGKPIPYVAPHPPKDFRPGMPIKRLLASFLAQAQSHPDAAIPVERINGSILLLSGDDDHLWPSAQMAKQIVARLKAAHFPHIYRALSYAGAGHVAFVGNPALLTRPAEQLTVSPMLGGSLQANRAAWRNDWPRALRFLSESLGRK
ncbi:MAG TPA: acyl-CoA thioester hydrolase/BAAT C-terminal domain-containing protein [Steroidobacteraceae bacterium]|nr:acyl-CoA thioester hydrolase/BAAT C-terminal domain-containing protein [Steroidobacteraceae bacterium]